MIYFSMRILAAICLSLTLLLAVTAQAAEESEARRVLENTINQVLAELKQPALKNPSSRDSVLARVEIIIERLFSFNELSMRTVGASWKEFSPDQKRRFQDAFEVLLRETYLEKLKDYNGETVSYVGETSSSKGDKVEIATVVNLKDKPVVMSYRLLNKSGWLVYDVIIEGVSMVQNYRSQFQEVLRTGDPEKLINLVRVKADEARALNRK